MPMIGVRELRQQASEVIRCVREENAEYVITYQGRPVAILLPLDTEQAEAEMVQATKRVASGRQGQAEQVHPEIREARPAYVLAERPVSELENELMQAAQRLADQRKTTLGEVLSELAERVSARSGGDTRDGVPLFPVQPDAGTVTLELVNQLRDETP
jgi:prevent-host-death family protein